MFESIIAEFKQLKQDKFRYELILEDLVGARSQTRQQLLQVKQTEYKSLLFSFKNSQDKLATAFFTLAENIIRYRKFYFVDVDDAIQEFVMICFEKIDRFDPSK